MQPQLKDKICRAIMMTLKRGGRDVISMSERIGDAVELILDMESEASGIGSVPEALQDGQAWDFTTNEPAQRERPKFDIPPAPDTVARGAAGKASTSKLIALPGDREFQETKPTDLPKQNKRAVISALEVQRRPIRRPGANLAQKQHWSEPDLMGVVIDNTPDRIDFEVEGPEGETVKMHAVKNVINQQGMGSVLLTYRHPAVSVHSGGDVTVDLIAKWPFSLYSERVDFDEALDGPTGIMVQLRGMYRDRSSRSWNPQSGPEPPSLSRQAARLSPMVDTVEMQTEYGEDGRLIDPGNRVYEDHRERQRQNNDSLAPTGSRFKA